LTAEIDALRAEVKRLTLADKQWADHVKRLSVQVEETARECGIQKTDNERLRAENERLQTALDLEVEMSVQQFKGVERLRAALERAADAPCTHCSATDMHGERNTAHFIADQALNQS
jgi:hypothetical protein